MRTKLKNKLSRSVRNKRSDNGFTMVDLMVGAAVTTVIVASGGAGVATMMDASTTANAKSERRVEINRSLDFMTSEVRDASKIVINVGAKSNSEISPNFQPPSAQLNTESVEKVLAVNIPGATAPVVYYSATPVAGKWSGSKVVFRWGPSINSDGTYEASDPSTWKHQAVIDNIDGSTGTLACTDAGWTPSGTPGFLACVDPSGKTAKISEIGSIRKLLGRTEAYGMSIQAGTKGTLVASGTSVISGGATAAELLAAGGSPSVTPSETPVASPSDSPSVTASETPVASPSDSPSVTPSGTPVASPSNDPSGSTAGTTAAATGSSPSVTPSETKTDPSSGYPSGSTSGTSTTSSGGYPSGSTSGTSTTSSSGSTSSSTAGTTTPSSSDSSSSSGPGIVAVVVDPASATPSGTPTTSPSSPSPIPTPSSTPISSTSSGSSTEVTTPPPVAFAVNTGVVSTASTSTMTIRNLGGDITCGAGGVNIPVSGTININTAVTTTTTTTKKGKTTTSTSTVQTPISGAPRALGAIGTDVTFNNVPADAKLDITGAAGNNSVCGRYSFSANSTTAQGSQVLTLVDGDVVPLFTPLGGQRTIDSFMKSTSTNPLTGLPLIDATTGKVALAKNQVIYLFELGTTSKTSTAYDMQDLVVLATITPTTTTAQAYSNSSSSNGKCNNGVGNGSDGCTPGNSTSKDEKLYNISTGALTCIPATGNPCKENSTNVPAFKLPSGVTPKG